MLCYVVKELSADEFKAHFSKLRDKVFKGSSHSYKLFDVLSDYEKEQFVKLQKNLAASIQIYLGVFLEGEIIAWSWGYQESASKFYMCNSAVLPEFRRKGIYTDLMNNMLKRLKKIGFQEIYSKHTATNNAVIIPKLKAGFVVTGIEISDLFGSLVVLTYHTNEVRRKIQNYRSGQRNYDKELKQIFEK